MRAKRRRKKKLLRARRVHDRIAKNYEFFLFRCSRVRCGTTQAKVDAAETPTAGDGLKSTRSPVGLGRARERVSAPGMTGTEPRTAISDAIIVAAAIRRAFCAGRCGLRGGRGRFRCSAWSCMLLNLDLRILRILS
eukprot:SAG31_NODE_2610_length_5382_cov_5.371948_3_plen_136_part_00